MTDPIRFIATLNQDEACQVIDDWFGLIRHPLPAKFGDGLYEVVVTIEWVERREESHKKRETVCEPKS